MNGVTQFLSRLRCNPPATQDEMRRLERAVGLSLPDEYLELLRTANGAAGTVGESYIVFLRASEVERARELDMEFGKSGRYLAFATDGANTNYAFDTESKAPYPIVGQDKIDDEGVVQLARDFTEFYERLRHRKLGGIEVHFSKEQIADFLKRSAAVRKKGDGGPPQTT